MRNKLLILFIIISSQVHGYDYKDDTACIYAEALLWQLREGSADNWGQEIPPSGTDRTITILKVPFNWSPGFRVGVGYNSSYDHWDTNFYYTWYKTTKTTSAQVTTGGISSAYIGNFFANNTTGGSITASPTYRNAGMRWKFLFNTLDLELGRKFGINEKLLFRPFIGLKGGIINQKIYTTWQNPTNAANFTTAYENLKNDFYGIGPMLGLNTTWTIYKTQHRDIRFFGNVSGAILWGHWSFMDQYNNDAPLSINVGVSNISGASSMARVLMGFEWDHTIGTQLISVRLGYEAQVWFDQLQYYSYNMGRLNNLLSLQGGVLGICWYFN